MQNGEDIVFFLCTINRTVCSAILDRVVWMHISVKYYSLLNCLFRLQIFNMVFATNESQKDVHNKIQNILLFGSLFCQGNILTVYCLYLLIFLMSLKTKTYLHLVFKKYHIWCNCSAVCSIKELTCHVNQLYFPEWI